MRFHVLAASVCLLAAARGQSLPVGEFPIDTAVVYAPASWPEEYPKVAFDGTNYLVVWADSRWDDHIYATRFSPEGRTLDPGGIQVSNGAESEVQPDVAFDGTNYLVVFTCANNGFYDIYAARVTPQGTVLDPDGIPVSTRQRNQSDPAVAFDGTNYLVVWQDDSSGQYAYDVYAARVTPQGTVLDPGGITVSAGPEREVRPRVTRLGTGFLVVWLDKRNGNDDIYAARVSSAGVVLDPAGIAITTAARSQDVPNAAWDGSNALVVWQDNRTDSVDIYGSRVTAQGTVLDPAGIKISSGPGWQFEPTAAFDGTNYLVAWSQWTGRPQDDFDIWAGRVTPQGTVLDPAGFVVSDAHNEQWYENIAYGNSSLLVVWQDERNEQEDIFGARVTPQGQVLDTAGLVVAAVANEQWNPAAAFDGTNYLVAWEDYRSGEYADIYAARISPTGTVLDALPLLLVADPEDQNRVAVAFDGTNYLVVWEDERQVSNDDVYACRVTPRGAVLDSGGLAVSAWSDDEEGPALTRGGTNCLVVWEDNRNDSRDVYGARVAPDGTVLDPDGIPISTMTGLQWRPDIAFDGTNWLAVWQDSRSGQYDIYAARVAQSGTILDPDGIPICTAPQSQWSPQVAFDGTRYLVVWEDPRNGTYHVYGARVTTDGTVLDPNGFCIAGGTTTKTNVAVGWDGNDFLVVWADERSGETQADIYGARVTGQGAVLDSFPIVRQPDRQTCPSLAHGSGSQMLLAYEGWTTCNAVRVWGKLSPLPGTEEAPNAGGRVLDVGPTIVRGSLFLPSALLSTRYSLLTPDGRKAMDLQPGNNDIRHLAPGVYFVREYSAFSAQQSELSAVRKVVVTR
ncbi:MAG: hypothetical protein ABIL25_01705 [candidate division WOR-3 bacterium]